MASSTSSQYTKSTWNCNYRSKNWLEIDYANDFLSFINENPSEFHATEYVAKVLEDNGFIYLPERDSWTDNDDFINMIIGDGGKFYTKRNGTSIAAFVMGSKWKPGMGVGLAGAHIDAITAKLKPVSIVETSEENGAYIRLGVAPYGGALSSLWLDRDLGLAGRIIVKDPKTGAIRSKLVKLDHPIGKIPTLAPHFGAVADKPYNKETNMVPLIGLESSFSKDYDKTPTSSESKSPLIGKHDIRLLRAIAKAADVELNQIIQLELQLYDFQHGRLGGLSKEFIFAPRLDDKLCVYAALHGLLASAETAFEEGNPNESILNMVTFFDNEEVGSLSRQGARGTLFMTVLERIIAHYEEGTDETLRRTLANSFFVSADTTHAVNPNFVDVYLEHHRPKLNTGITIKFNVNMANTTDSVSASLIEAVCAKTENKVQYFHIRNDSRSGGTIGPALSSKTGMRSLDVGIPQLAMHSIRATTGSKDVQLGVQFFKAFFENWATVDKQYKLGDL